MSMRTRQKGLSNILVLLIFTIFMVTVLLILLRGADVMQHVMERNSSSYERRTAVQYITTRIRQADQAGMISVRTMEDGDALVLSRDIEGEKYDTLLYCHDGYLKELFTESGLEADGEFGEEILPLAQLKVEDNGTHLQIDMTFIQGDTQTLFFDIVSNRGA